MKRLIAAIIAISYLCLSTGFTLHVHYCMGKRIGASLFDSVDTHQCSHCGMEKKSSKNGCCKDEHKVVKASKDAADTKAFISYSPVLDALAPQPPTYNIAYSAAIRSISTGVSGKPHGPPLLSSLRLHVRNCVFLI